MLCRDFTAGRCKRGNRCPFLHNDNQSYDRRHSESNVTDEFESRNMDSGASRYSADIPKRNSASERSLLCCNDFLKGRCSKGALCKYAHHDATSDGKSSMNDLYKDGDNDVSRRGTHPSRSYDLEHRKSNGVVCKFFAAGNCRNGKHCRYLHILQEVATPGRRLDETRVSDHNLDTASQVWKGATWDDPVSDVSQVKGWPDEKSESLDSTKPRVTAWRSWDEVRVQNNNPDSARQVWKGAKWEGTMEDVPLSKGLPEGKNENLDTVKENGISWSGNCSWDVDLVSNSHTLGSGVPTGDEPVPNDEKLSLQWKLQDTPNDMGVSVSKGTENFFCAMGIRGGQPSNSVSVSFPETSIHPRELDVGGLVSSKKQYAGGVSQPGVFDESYLQKPNFAEGVSTAYPVEGLNSGGLGQPAVSLCPTDGSSQITKNLLILGSKISDGPYMGGNLRQSTVHPASSQSPIFCEQQMQDRSDIVSERGITSEVSTALAQLIENKVLISQLYAAQQTAFDGVSSCAPNTVSSEQLQESSHFSTAEAQKPENNKQVHQLSAAVAPHSVAEGLSTVHDSKVFVAPVSATAFQLDEAGEKQYDPICDSIDQKLPTGAQSLCSQVGPKSFVHEPTTVSASAIQPASTATGAGSSRNGMSNQSHDLHQVPVNRVDQNGGAVDEQLENGPNEETAIDGGTDEGKKGKDAKGLRAFKFALAEFAKELLKPTWKEGLVSKEVYKTIVKKVVDKVLDTFQPAHIPQTKEKIDQYLSFSKSKISKLVQVRADAIDCLLFFQISSCPHLW
ncbi:hypothetical protein Dimus_017720 [Dionaea muscipula]